MLTVSICLKFSPAVAPPYCGALRRAVRGGNSKKLAKSFVTLRQNYVKLHHVLRENRFDPLHTHREQGQRADASISAP